MTLATVASTSSKNLSPSRVPPSASSYDRVVLISFLICSWQMMSIVPETELAGWVGASVFRWERKNQSLRTRSFALLFLIHRTTESRSGNRAAPTATETPLLRRDGFPPTLRRS